MAEGLAQPEASELSLALQSLGGPHADPGESGVASEEERIGQIGWRHQRGRCSTDGQTGDGQTGQTNLSLKRWLNP